MLAEFVHSCCKVIFRFSNLASWIFCSDQGRVSALWNASLLLVFTVDATGNGKCLRAEAGSSPFGKTACQGLCPHLHPLCLLFMSPAALTETLIHKGQAADSRLMLTACVCPVLGDRGNKQYSHTCWAGSQSVCRDAAEEKDIQESAVKADSE